MANMMNAITRARETLDRQYPDVSYECDEHSIAAAPRSGEGFPVRLVVDEKELAESEKSAQENGHPDPDIFPYAVHLDLGHEAHWSEGFSDAEDAIEWFLFGLSNRCRLKYEWRGRKCCRTTVEYLDGDQWKVHSRRGFVFSAFRKTCMIEYKRNVVDVRVGE